MQCNIAVLNCEASIILEAGVADGSSEANTFEIMLTCSVRYSRSSDTFLPWFRRCCFAHIDGEYYPTESRCS
jgi:hypothetical protein